MNSRIENLVSEFSRCHLDAYLVTNDVNITYLTEYPSPESWLLVSSKKAFYITDARYSLEARKSLKGVNVKQCSKSFLGIFSNLVVSYKLKRIGFDTRHISLSTFKKIKKVCPKGVKLISQDKCVEKFRQIKGKDEIAHIRECIQLNLLAYGYLRRIIKPGFTEKEVLIRLERYVKSKGASFSFAPIIASGANSCFPHAQISDRKIRVNESVLVDMGIAFKGYKSDLTRMFFLGKISPHIHKVYEIVSTAQKRAIEKIRSNVAASEIDKEARNYLRENKLSKYFVHSLGHGIGLEVHEDPLISEKNTHRLKEGMIFTVEPAVYIPGRFGIRVEDMVLVTKNGYEILS